MVYNYRALTLVLIALFLNRLPYVKSTFLPLYWNLLCMYICAWPLCGMHAYGLCVKDQSDGHNVSVNFYKNPKLVFSKMIWVVQMFSLNVLKPYVCQNAPSCKKHRPMRHNDYIWLDRCHVNLMLNAEEMKMVDMKLSWTQMQVHAYHLTASTTHIDWYLCYVCMYMWILVS